MSGPALPGSMVAKPAQGIDALHYRRKDGLLETLCWCGARTLGVPAQDVRAGITGSCGLPGCEESWVAWAMAKH